MPFFLSSALALDAEQALARHGPGVVKMSPALSSNAKCNTPADLISARLFKALSECCHAILFASVRGRKRPDRRLCRPRGGRWGPVARAPRFGRKPPSPGSCGGPLSLGRALAGRGRRRQRRRTHEAAKLVEKIVALNEKRGRYRRCVASSSSEPARTRSRQTDPGQPRHGRAIAEGRRSATTFKWDGRDAKNKLIVIEQAVTNQVVDMGSADLKLLELAAKSWEETARSDVVAGSRILQDRSYIRRPASRRAAFPRCQAQRGSSVREGLFRRTSSRYDAPGSTPCRLPGRVVPTPIRQVLDALRSRKDRFRQPESLPRFSLRAALVMHERRRLIRFPPRKRRRSRSHGRAPQSEAGDYRPPPRGRRAPVRRSIVKQWMYQSSLPDARPRQRARRVQPDRARCV